MSSILPKSVREDEQMFLIPEYISKIAEELSAIVEVYAELIEICQIQQELGGINHNEKKNCKHLYRNPCLVFTLRGNYIEEQN